MAVYFCVATCVHIARYMSGVRTQFVAERKNLVTYFKRHSHNNQSVSIYRPCPAWQRRASTCGRALLPHADKHMLLYVLELCKSEAKRPHVRGEDTYSVGSLWKS
jgi:hypothetical protein